MAADLCEDVRRLILEKAEKQCQATMILVERDEWPKYEEEEGNVNAQGQQLETRYDKHIDRVKMVITRNKYDPPYHATFHIFDRLWSEKQKEDPPSDMEFAYEIVENCPYTIERYNASDPRIHTIHTYTRLMCETLYKELIQYYDISYYYTQETDYFKKFHMIPTDKPHAFVFTSFYDEQKKIDIRAHLGIPLNVEHDMIEKKWALLDALVFNF